MLQLTTVTADIGVLPLGVGGCMYVCDLETSSVSFVCLFPLSYIHIQLEDKPTGNEPVCVCLSILWTLTV